LMKFVNAKMDKADIKVFITKARKNEKTKNIFYLVLS
jgi:hypothetical protein